MIVKKEMYPKTKRLPCAGFVVRLHEKLDGSNLAIYKENGEIYIAQRSTVFSLSDLNDSNFDEKIMYPGLKKFLEGHGDYLKKNLHELSAICGEWLGMGKLKYDSNLFPNRWQMFAKARYDAETGKFNNFNYDERNFMYVFDNCAEVGFPDWIGVVPLVAEINYMPNKENMDALYSEYCDKVQRDVEGFVIDMGYGIVKYVRKKNGKFCEHFDRE